MISDEHIERFVSMVNEVDLNGKPSTYLMNRPCRICGRTDEMEVDVAPFEDPIRESLCRDTCLRCCLKKCTVCHAGDITDG